VFHDGDSASLTPRSVPSADELHVPKEATVVRSDRNNGPVILVPAAADKTIGGVALLRADAAVAVPPGPAEIVTAGADV